MAEGERRSYLILREDGLVIHTKPVTRDEAWWLYQLAYKSVEDRAARTRYLGEYGNVMDASKYVERLRQLGVIYAKIYNDIAGFYEGPEELRERVDEAFSYGIYRRLKRLPEARRIVEELLDEAREFLARPVEPKLIGPRPVRYLELERHLWLSTDGTILRVVPQPEWHACKKLCCDLCHGISVFPDSLWLWFQPAYTYVVAVRRDVDDKDVVAALANDRVVQEFLKWHVDAFRELLREHEKELTDKGHEDALRKAKIVLTAFELLTAGRNEEEGVPA